MNAIDFCKSTWLRMKFWTDDYDTYASEDVAFIKEEQIKAGVIDAEDFEEDDWEEVSPTKRIWICGLDDIDSRRYKEDKEYKESIDKQYSKTLEEAFADKDNLYYSETGKAWFMGSTEY